MFDSRMRGILGRVDGIGDGRESKENQNQHSQSSNVGNHREDCCVCVVLPVGVAEELVGDSEGVVEEV